MSIKMISYDPVSSEYRGSVMISRIVRLSKKEGVNDGDITLIHLDTGEILETTTSINTLEVRINLADR